MSRWVRLLSVVSCLGVCASGARAEGVLLRETRGLRDGLCVALRIQLTSVAEVRCEPEPAGPSLSERLADASRRSVALGATLGVLLERDPDPRTVRMYLVSTEPGQAVIAIERIEDRADADVDRSLALKVQSALVALASAPPVDPVAPTLARVLAPPAPPAPRTRGHLVVEAGGLLSVGTLQRWGGAASLGGRVTRDASFAEVVVTGRLLAAAHPRARDTAADVDEWGAALELRAARTLGWLSVGGLLAVGAERVHARGNARDGSVGGVRLGVARLAVGLDLRLRVARGASLRLAPALELYPVQHRFAVDGETLATLGRARLNLPLTLIVALPLAPGGH